MDTSHPKILIIDDDASMRDMYARRLTHEQFEVLTAGDGKEGLKTAQEKKPDVILLDVMMPGHMNGFDVLELLKKDEGLKSIPVIMLTNLGSEEMVAHNIGAVEYLVKANASLDEVVAKIRTHIS